MSPARIVVRAVVVSDGRSPHLYAALESVLSQDPAPDEVHLALTAPVEAPPGGWSPRIDVFDVEAGDLGAAVDAVLNARPGEPSELVWILHDDMAPLPGALAALTATARKRRLAGVVGAAHVRWDATDRLVSLGTTTTRVGARRIPLVEEDDVDQGQYAERDDVLAVSLGGALVRRELWEALDGLDPAADGWPASLDFSRRAWRAGYDVVAVPAARVRHSQERLYARRGASGGGRRATYGERRASEWYHALVYGPWWSVPLIALWALAGSLARAVLRVAQNEPRLLAADLLVPWRVLGLLVHVPRARSRVRRAGRATDAERRLLADSRAVARHIRALEWGARGRARQSPLPSDVVRAELATAAARRRLTLVALSIGLAAFSIVLHPTWLSGLAGGQMLTGATLGVTDVALGDLWNRALTGWSTQAFGAPAMDPGLSLLLVPLAAIPGGLATWLGVLLLLSPLLAGLSAWAASGAFTRALPTRALAAAAYGLWPMALESAAQGRVAAVVVHVVGPLAVLGLARAGGWHRGEPLADGAEHPVVRRPSRSAAMGAGAALGVAVIAAPMLLPLVIVAVAVAGAAAGSARWRVWGAAIAPLAVSLPSIAALVASPDWASTAVAIGAREPGPSATADGLSAAEMLLGGIGETGDVPLLFEASMRSLPILVMVAAAIAAVVGRRRSLSFGALALAAVSLALAVGVQGITLSPDLGADAPAGSGWYGPAMSVVVVAALTLICTASAPRIAAPPPAETVPATAPQRSRLRLAASRTASAVAIAIVGVAVLGSAAASAWPGRAPLGDVEPADRDVLPLVASLEQEARPSQRVLLVDEDEGAVSYVVVPGDGVEVLSTAGTLLANGAPATRGPAAAAVTGPGVLGEEIASLAAGGDGDLDAFARWGIGVIVVAPGADRLAGALGQNPDLQLMGASDRGTSWRVGAPDGDGRVALATFVTADGATLPVPMGATQGTWRAPGAGTLVLAHVADRAWTATAGGAILDGGADGQGRQTFDVTGAGEVVVAYDDRAYRVWFWVGLTALVWALIASIPVPSRRLSREERTP
ncbi:glycosyltransferase [Demequina sp. NBRC 110053]|uniref:glycosyltransferase n=1 Tax=Demequina sp. NBRC 110053 TaxID=1570342 RepID=UPI000A05A46A|nr:glycosyltransferase [Demequina sp. NBRC 110053]